MIEWMNEWMTLQTGQSQHWECWQYHYWPIVGIVAQYIKCWHQHFCSFSEVNFEFPIRKTQWVLLQSLQSHVIDEVFVRLGKWIILRASLKTFSLVCRDRPNTRHTAPDPRVVHSGASLLAPSGGHNYTLSLSFNQKQNNLVTVVQQLLHAA